jgi:hypothetical protein
MRRTNALQRDPNLAKAFDNIASMFAPPSGADFAASANARATNQNAARIADLYSRAGNAGLTPAEMAALDQQMAVQNGGWQNSRWRFQNDSATTLKQTGLNNATTLEQERIKGQNALTLQNAKPVTANQNQAVYLPGQTQTATGLAPVLFGPQELDRGKAYDRPDGAGGMTRVMGPAMPRTMDEAKASVFDQMSPRERNAIVFGSTPIEQVIMGDKTTNVTRPESLGQTPVPSAGQTPKAFVAQLADGRQVPAVQRPDGSFAHAQTGERLPDDLKPFNVPTPTGKNEDVGLGTTQNKTMAGTIRGAVANADRLMAEIDQTLRANPASAGLAANVLSFSQDLGQVFREFGEKFGNPNTPVSFRDLQAIADRVAPGNYNPVYRRVRAQLLELAYANARLDNPKGEVGVKALERQIDALGLGTVGNDQAVLAVLDASRGRLRRSLAEADVLDGTAPAPTADTLYTPQPRTPAAPAAGRARIISEEPIR